MRSLFFDDTDLTHIIYNFSNPDTVLFWRTEWHSQAWEYPQLILK